PKTQIPGKFSKYPNSNGRQLLWGLQTLGFPWDLVLGIGISLARSSSARLATTCFEPRTKNHTRVFQTPRNDGHVLECGGVPPLLRKMRVFFRSRRQRRSNSGGAPPHSKTPANLGAANDKTPKNYPALSSCCRR